MKNNSFINHISATLDTSQVARPTAIDKDSTKHLTTNCSSLSQALLTTN
jgi:hypothetical protein